LSNVTVEGFNTTASRAAFIATVAITLNVSTDSVRITKIQSKSRGRRLSAITAQDTSSLLEIFYTVIYNTTNPEPVLIQALSQAVSSGEFTSTLQTFALKYGAAALQIASSSSVSGSCKI
jgi:hypothetical protein